MDDSIHVSFNVHRILFSRINIVVYNVYSVHNNYVNAAILHIVVGKSL